MPEDSPDMHYEEKFELPLWKMVQQRAEEKDISYNAAYGEVLLEYQKLIRYKDVAWEDAQISQNNRETAELKKRGK